MCVDTFLDFEVGSVITGKELKATGYKFYKIINEKNNHNGMSYKYGWNVDILPFATDGECVPGGIYFTDERHILSWCDFGYTIREITVADDEPVYVGEGKFRAHKVFMGKKQSLLDVQTLKSFITNDAHVSTVALCTAHYLIRHAARKGRTGVIKYLLTEVCNRKDSDLVNAVLDDVIKCSPATAKYIYKRLGTVRLLEALIIVAVEHNNEGLLKFCIKEAEQYKEYNHNPFGISLAWMVRRYYAAHKLEWFIDHVPGLKFASWDNALEFAALSDNQPDVVDLLCRKVATPGDINKALAELVKKLYFTCYINMRGNDYVINKFNNLYALIKNGADLKTLDSLDREQIANVYTHAASYQNIADDALQPLADAINAAMDDMLLRREAFVNTRLCCPFGGEESKEDKHG